MQIFNQWCPFTLCSHLFYLQNLHLICTPHIVHHLINLPVLVMFSKVTTYMFLLWLWNARSLPRGEQFLVRWAVPRLHDIDALSRMVDPYLNGTYPIKSLSRFADIISSCIMVNFSTTFASYPSYYEYLLVFTDVFNQPFGRESPNFGPRSLKSYRNSYKCSRRKSDIEMLWELGRRSDKMLNIKIGNQKVLGVDLTIFFSLGKEACF